MADLSINPNNPFLSAATQIGYQAGGFGAPKVNPFSPVRGVEESQEYKGTAYAGFNPTKWGRDLSGMQSQKGGLGDAAIYVKGGRAGARFFMDEMTAAREYC